MHGIAFHARPEFHNPFIADLSHQPLQHFSSQVLVGHFASAEAQAGFYLVAFTQKPQHVVSFGDVIVLIHVDAELYFLQDDLLLVLFRRPFLLFLLVEELAVIHDAAHRGIRSGRDLYQVKILFTGLSGRILGFIMPSCSPSGPITRTSRARMRSFILIKRLSMRSS